MSNETILSSPLLRLPGEIQTRIFSYLEPKGIRNILLTCQQLYQVGLPLSVHMFRNYKYLDDGVYDNHEKLTVRTRSLKFLHYISITKPELARHVKELLFGHYPAWHDVEVDTLAKPGPNEMGVYRRLVEEAFAHESHQEYERYCINLIEDLERGVPDAVNALILIVCSRVELLCYAESHQPRHLERVLQLASRNPQPSPAGGQENRKHPLANLKQVYHESQDTKYGYLVWHRQAALLFQLPNLSTYEIVMANGSEEGGPFFDALPPRSSAVEHIFLRRSAISQVLVRHLFSPVKHLRSFEYTRGVYHMYDSEMMPRDLMKAILPHAETLEYLHVNWEDDWYKNGWADQPERLFMGVELRAMTALKTLVTGMQALTGLLDAQPEDVFGPDLPLGVEGAPRLVNCLPENLEDLVIHGCGKAILDQAQEFLDVVSLGERYKNLRRIRFAFNQENIDPHLVQFTHGSSSVKLEVVFQTKENRIYDLITHLQIGSIFLPHICSPLWGPKFREQWLAIRGMDVASATVNQGVHELPGIDFDAEPSED
ncbi:hypothetical protein V2G26_011105 [Clonostachys chloroleuca]